MPELSVRDPDLSVSLTLKQARKTLYVHHLQQMENGMPCALYSALVLVWESQTLVSPEVLVICTFLISTRLIVGPCQVSLPRES